MRVKTIDEIYEAWLKYRRACGLKAVISRLIPSFVRTCKKESDGYFNKDIVNRWASKHDTETEYSHYLRVTQIRTFLFFAQKRGWIDFDLPECKIVKPIKLPPYDFTQEELEKFFYYCDHYESASNIKIRTQINKIEIPVFFRLLYSTGMRTTEARLLLCEDVDLKTGVITIRHTKGYNEHTVVLHDSMLEVMQKYDAAISKILPMRRVFFPNAKDKERTVHWVCDHFTEAWSKVTDKHTVPYQLRHNYAIENINSWTNQGFDLHSKLLYLSKSMGHCSIEETLYYYGIVPRLHDVITELSGDRFDNVLPDLTDVDL